MDLEFVHSIALGMQSVDEVDANIEFFEKRSVSKDIKSRLDLNIRKLHIEDWCSGCGRCIKICKHKALNKSSEDNKVHVDSSRCVICGYCGRACREFAIKVR